MMVYSSLYLLVLFSFFATRSINIQSKRKAYFLVFSFLLILAIFALRHPYMGMDLGYKTYNGYLSSFREISTFSFKQIFSMTSYMNYEKGYVLLNKLLSYISTDNQWIIFSVSLIILIPIFIGIYKESDDVFLSVLIYMGLPVFQLVFSGLRQSIAIGICFLSIGFIKKRKIIPFILFVLLASLFHDTALVFLLAYPMYRIKVKRNTRFLTLIIIFLAFIFRYQIFGLFAGYFQSEAVPDNNNSFLLFILFVLIYVYCTLFSNDKDQDANGLLNLFFIACCVQALAGVYSLCMRIGYYYMISLVLLLPKILKNIKFNERVSWKTVISICFIAFGFYCLLRGESSRLYPYYFFWENI